MPALEGRTTEDKVTNVVVAGLGGQGVITCSDIVAHAAMLAGYDVKKAEIHGMSQRGGSVSSDVRFGTKVFSPMVSSGAADYLLVLADTQVPVVEHYLAPDGVLLTSAAVRELSNPRLLNTALLGCLSNFLRLNDALWHEAIKQFVPQKYTGANLEAFAFGKHAQNKGK